MKEKLRNYRINFVLTEKELTHLKKALENYEGAKRLMEDLSSIVERQEATQNGEN